MYFWRKKIFLLLVGVSLALTMVGCSNESLHTDIHANTAQTLLAYKTDNKPGIVVKTGPSAENLSIAPYQPIFLEEFQPLLENNDDSETLASSFAAVQLLLPSEIGIVTALDRISHYLKKDETFSIEVGQQSFVQDDSNLTLYIDSLDMYVSGGTDSLKEFVDYIYYEKNDGPKSLDFIISGKTKLSGMHTINSKRLPFEIIDNIYLDIHVTDFTLDPNGTHLTGTLSTDIRYSMMMNYFYTDDEQKISTPVKLEFRMRPIKNLDLSTLSGSFIRENIGLHINDTNQFDSRKIWNTLGPELWGANPDRCLSIIKTRGNAEGSIAWYSVSRDVGVIRTMLAAIAKMYQAYY